MVPTDLLRLETIDFLLCNDCRFYPGVAPACESGLRQSWRQRRGIRSCSKRCRARDRAESKHQKMTAFHDVSPSTGFSSPGVLPRRDEWPLNRWRGVIVQRNGNFTHSSFRARAMTTTTVMAGLDPAIHVLLRSAPETSMPGTRPGMTTNINSSLRANGSRECAPDDRLREAIQGQRMEHWIASSLRSSQ
jgi:hypothetical protein